MDVRAVVFDFHDTLIRMQPTDYQVLAKMLDKPVDQCKDAWKRVDKRLQHGRDTNTWPDPEGGDWWTSLYAVYLEELGAQADAGEVARRMQDLFTDPNSYQLFPEARGVLVRLRQGQIRLGILSNTDIPLTPILRAVGIDDLIEVAIPVRAHGVEKPDPAAFQMAVDQLSLLPNQCLYVGDNPDEDGVGAETAGLNVVLVNRHAAESGIPNEPFTMISDLRELLPILGLND